MRLGKTGNGYMITSEFWQNKKVFLTGHTGFKGGWLSLWLQMLGADVIGFALPPEDKPNLFSLANVASGMTNINGDIRDLTLLREIIKKNTPEIVIHMAAQSLVRHSYHEPVETYATNVMGTVNVLEAVRGVGSVKVIMNVTSDKCYENYENLNGYHEDDQLGGYDPYSNSKACSELVTAAFRHSFFKEGVSVATMRAGNVIGGGDWAIDRLIPDVMTACISQSPIEIRSPDAIRPWQYVLDVLHGYLLLAEKMYQYPETFSEAWNFGPPKSSAKSVSWVTHELCELWQSSLPITINRMNQPHETQYLTLDSSKAQEKLGWKTRWDLKKSLSETVRWYQHYAQNKDMQAFTVKQLSEFMAQ